jgi:hypothetical protein
MNLRDAHRAPLQKLGRPGLETGTNPEGFRDCFVNWRTARLKLRVADSFFVLESARGRVLRPLMRVPSPLQVRFGLRTDASCDCCRADAPRSGARAVRSTRCSIDWSRPEERKPSHSFNGSAGTRTRNQRLKRALLYRLSYRPISFFLLSIRFLDRDQPRKLSELLYRLSYRPVRSFTF